MKIYSMTATFGKLENQSLTLQPGLNVISAPNEWGKSTWCAFLATMLYGLDTREKTTKTNLALKERYAPWSGAPMAGRIDLHWNGRDITIERWSKGRTPLGEFRAYETESGLPVPELTGTTCGEMLLGVEKSVFLRAGFLRLSDLPITQDEALRRRLNALVTTGDESGTGDELAQKLKDLKNKVRSNRTNGLIPQAETQKRELEEKLSELQALGLHSRDLRENYEAIRQQIALLENHKAALAYQAAEDHLYRLAAAEEAARQGAQQLQAAEEACRALPPQEEVQQQIQRLQQLQQQQLLAREAAQLLPQPPREPPAPMCFYGMDGPQALSRVREDTQSYQQYAAQQKKPFPLWIPGIISAAIGIVLMVLLLFIPGVLLLAAGAGLLITYAILYSKFSRTSVRQQAQMQAICSRYGGGEPADWLAEATAYAQQRQLLAEQLAQYNAQRQQVAERIRQCDDAVLQASQGMGIPAALAHCSGMLRQQEELLQLRRRQEERIQHAQSLRTLSSPVAKPTAPDPLTHSAQETQHLLEQANRNLQLLQQQLGQCQGRMEALGDATALQQALTQVNTRLEQLSRTYQALELAQQTLQTATDTLQRRFAPRIAEQARDLFSQLTGGRYDRLNLTQELSVDTASTEDIATRSAQWRSEGTIDQLYLALRLAVARELTPQAPLILDDALVRFDDTRHAAAMALLRREAMEKQVILFTCQSRET